MLPTAGLAMLEAEMRDRLAAKDAEIKRLRHQCGAWASAMVKLCDCDLAREIFDEQARIYAVRMSQPSN